MHARTRTEVDGQRLGCQVPPACTLGFREQAVSREADTQALACTRAQKRKRSITSRRLLRRKRQAEVVSGRMMV